MKIWRSKPQLASIKFRERRLDIRKPTSINAAVCSEYFGTKPCVISELSLTGMFLVLSEQSNFTPGTELQLLFYCNMDNCEKLCFEWVRVAGMRKNGVAVSFDHFDNQHQNNIQQMLHQSISHSESLPVNVSAHRHGFTAEHSQKSA